MEEEGLPDRRLRPAAGKFFLLLTLLLGPAACGSSDSPPPVPAGTGFVDRIPGSGIDFVNHTGWADRKDWIHESKGGGALVLDYDGDGRMDVYLVDGNACVVDDEGVVRTRTLHREAGNRLYRNEGNWRFRDVTEAAGVGDTAWGFGGGVGDYDNDGRPDIYVCNWGENRLYHNNGDGTFTDVAARAGVEGGTSYYSTGATFFDADGDGDLDLYVSNYNDIERLMREAPLKERTRPYQGVVLYRGPNGTVPAEDRFYRNRGDGTFADETETALAGQEARFAFTAVAADYDRDGDQDVYVANDSRPNTLWLNDGTGHFRDVGASAGVDVSAFGVQQAGMGCDAADYDQDGWADIFVTNFARDQNTLYRNLSGEVGTLLFEDFTGRAALAEGDFLKTCWGTKFVDFDRDGYLDLFVAAGHVFPGVDQAPDVYGDKYRQLPSVWMSGGPPEYRFHRLPEADGGSGLAIRRVGRGASFADLDDDGDVDVLVYCLNGPPLLLENRLPAPGAYFQLALRGRESNRDGFGARVTVRAGGGRISQVQEARVSASFLGANDPRLFWGLGSATRVDALEVEWPSGKKQRFENLPANHLYRLVEGGEPVRER